MEAKVERQTLLNAWLRRLLGADIPLTPASSDASFRQYFRLLLPNGQSQIVMDAPPEHEDNARFVRCAQQFAALGIHVPKVFASDFEMGFVLLEDLGQRPYLSELSDESADGLYGDALSALLTIQACGPVAGMPLYDRVLLERELQIFPEWLLQRHLGITPDKNTFAILAGAFEVMVKNALAQPRVLVHRDFHSRNLLVTSSPSPGVIDFQDAVAGPVTYDLVSLLRDCYVAWPQKRVHDWAWGYFELAVQSGVLRSEHQTEFMRWFDIMGMQRHLKAAGIFARLFRRDGKSGYLAELPRTLGYVVEVAARYAELAELGRFIARRVLPAL